MKSRVTTFALGFILAAVVTSGVAFFFQERLRKRHADCPLDSTEIYLRSLAALSESERTSIEAAFRKLTNEGLYPVMTSRMAAFRAVTALYDHRSDEASFARYAAETIESFHSSLKDASSDRELMFRLQPQIEALTKEVEEFLKLHPDVWAIVAEKRANQPPEPTATSVTPPAAQESRQP